MIALLIVVACFILCLALAKMAARQEEWSDAAWENWKREHDEDR